MTDIFFSYSSKDRDRVRPIHDALVAQGFQVFWDQKVPAGQNWELDSSAPHTVQMRNSVLVGDVGGLRQRPA